MVMMKKPHIDSKKKDILQAAMRLFATKGIDGISVKEIGDAAGVTDAAIYKHFKSKQAMALEAFSHYCGGYTRLIDYMAGQPGTFHSRFHRLIDEVLRMHDEEQYGMLLLAQQHEIFAEASRSGERQLFDALVTFIEQGIERGELPDQDARLSAVLILGAFNQMALSSLHGELPARLEPLAAEVKQRFSHLLGQL